MSASTREVWQCGLGAVVLLISMLGCGSAQHDVTGECDSSACVSADKNVIPYDVVDARYSRALDRIVIVSKAGPALHLFDPHTSSDESLALAAAPTCVDVSPDGKHAAVGHESLLSHVDLVKRSVTRTFKVPVPVYGVALGDNGYIYALPTDPNQNLDLYVAEVASGRVTALLMPGGQATGGTAAEVNRASTVLYHAIGNQAPSTLATFDITKGLPNPVATVVESKHNVGSGPFWLSRDGSRMYTPAGAIFSTATLALVGNLVPPDVEGANVVLGADDWSNNGTVAVLTGAGNPYGAERLETLEAKDFTRTSSMPMPQLLTPGGPNVSGGLFVFHDAAGTATFVIVLTTDPRSGGAVFGLASY